MGKRFAVRYDQTTDSKFYMCRGCHTHIALIQDSILTHRRSGTVILGNAENLVIDNPEDHVDIVCITVAFVNCSQCNMYLGWKCVQVLDGATDLFQEGKIALYLHNLLFCDGKQVLEAGTTKPAENLLISRAQDGEKVLEANSMKPPENILISGVQDWKPSGENMLISREVMVEDHF